ncbi:MAG: CDP-alcohol phosphatidyltransferase family protein [Actinomycetota bacterium]|nr:CDP-alcohol phosphatidyltransferase family protein [Actinomycetota bacterium]
MSSALPQTPAAVGAGAGQKKRDYWWTVIFTDPLAVPVVRFLTKHRWLTPDQVTIVALLLGLAVGPVFAIGTRWSLVVGGLLFYAAFIVDCTDGKLARALRVTSARGEALDHLADGGRRASASVGLAFYLWRADDVPHHDILWAVLYICLAYYFLEISGAEKTEAAGGVRGRWSSALARRRLLPNPGMPDVQAVVFIIGPLAGYVVYSLWVGIAMVSAAILLTVRRRL